jgi:hypothetical protein
MNNETTNAAGTSFKGYKATRNGRPVFVVNAGTLKSGGPGLKVMPARLAGYTGSHRPVAEWVYGPAVWVKAETVTA